MEIAKGKTPYKYWERAACIESDKAKIVDKW